MKTHLQHLFIFTIFLPLNLLALPSDTAGLIGPSRKICSGSQVGVIGSVSPGSCEDIFQGYIWQVSGNGNTWLTLVNETGETLYDADILSGNGKRYYRRGINCFEVLYTPVIIIELDQAIINPGSIDGDKEICSGDVGGILGNVQSASPLADLVGYKWQSFLFGYWSDIAGANASTLSVGTLSSSTSYRRLAITVCNTFPSNVVTIDVNSTPVNPEYILGNSIICQGSSAPTLYPSPLTPVPTGGFPLLGYKHQWQSSSDGVSSWTDVPLQTNSSYSPGILNNTTYYRKKTTSGCHVAYSNVVSVLVDLPTQGGQVSSSTSEEFGVASPTLSLFNNRGQVLKWQIQIGSDWNDLPNSSNTVYQANNVTQTGAFRAHVKNGVCPAQISSTATVSIYLIPTISIIGSEFISPGGSTKLVCSQGLQNYQWYFNNHLIVGGTEHYYTATRPGEYKVSVKASPTSPSYTTGGIHLLSTNDTPLQPMNYVRVTSFNKSGITQGVDLYDLKAADFQQTTSYFDGLGRQVQSIGLGDSPTGKDFIQSLTYDEFGREQKKLLPFAFSYRDGRYQPSASNLQYNFYNNFNTEVATDTAPYNQAVFEASPLNRVLKQGAHGSAWQPDIDPYSLTDRTVKKRYEFNGANEVVLFDYDFTTGAVSKAVGAAGYYQPYQLSANKTVDEHLNEVIEYVDKEGRTVCKKVQYDTDVNGKKYACTYYVYDDFGNLVVVLPPEAFTIFEN